MNDSQYPPSSMTTLIATLFDGSTSYVGIIDSASPLPMSLPHFSAFPPLATGCSVLFVLIALITYSTTWLSFHTQNQNGGQELVPRIIPYSLPWVGKALSFGWSTSKCVIAATRLSGYNTAFGLKLFGENMYFISGRDNLAKIRKYQGNITDPGIQSFCLVRIFGMAQKPVEMYQKDLSSIQTKPAEGTAVKPHNRIDYLTHANFVKMLSGDGLNNFFVKWHVSFARRLEALRIGRDWTEGSDLEKFWMPPLTAALNEAMAGPILENVNPDFTDNFIEFLPFVHGLMKGLPSWCMSRATVLRDSLNRDVKTWHSIARACFKQSDIEPVGGSDRWWGLAAMRERQTLFEGVDNWDTHSIASSDFGLLWGANINVHTAAIWMIVEIFRDPDLLKRVRSELDTISETPEDHSRWVEELMALPLLQSIYAEVLRLRVDVQTVFRDNQKDIQINKWTFPKKSLLLVPTRPAHRDEDFWNTRNGQYPLDRFWSDRFLAYHGDPESGPSRSTRPRSELNKDNSKQKPKFTTAGTADSWIPYGVGERACPGRFFAQREIVAFCAHMVRDYEIELLSLSAGGHVPANDVFYGLGVQRPRGTFPFRIRRLARPM